MVMFTDTHILLSSCSPNTVRTPSVLEGMIQYVQCPTDVNHWLSAAPPWNVLRLCNHLDWYMYIYYILYYIFISIISYMVFFLSDVSLYFFSRRFKSGPVPASCMGNPTNATLLELSHATWEECQECPTWCLVKIGLWMLNCYGSKMFKTESSWCLFLKYGSLIIGFGPSPSCY